MVGVLQLLESLTFAMLMHGFGTILAQGQVPKSTWILCCLVEICPCRLTFQVLVGEKFSCGYLVKMQSLMAFAVMCALGIQLGKYKNELRVLIDALENVGTTGEVKVAEWIRGLALSWTDKYNKQCLS